jgi:hypothetical protein
LFDLDLDHQKLRLSWFHLKGDECRIPLLMENHAPTHEGTTNPNGIHDCIDN